MTGTAFGNSLTAFDGDDTTFIGLGQQSTTSPGLAARTPSTAATGAGDSYRQRRTLMSENGGASNSSSRPRRHSTTATTSSASTPDNATVLDITELLSGYRQAWIR